MDGRKYSAFTGQYWETDWDFLKRLASREGIVLIADCTDPELCPRFLMGIPKYSPASLAVTQERRSSRNIKKYLEIAENRIPTVQESDFTTYEDVGYEPLQLGQPVDYDGKELTLVKIVTTLDNGLLKHTYTMSASEKMALVSSHNKNLTSVALSGKVSPAATSTPKSTWTSTRTKTKRRLLVSRRSCMPHNNEVFNLHFRDGREENAIAIRGARSKARLAKYGKPS